MDYLLFDFSELIAPISVAVVTLLGGVVFEFLHRGRERLKIKASSVELLDRIVNEREWKKSENRLVVEETFEQIYSRNIRFEEIKVLMYSESPSAAIRCYLRYRSSFEFNDKKTKFKFSKGKRPYWFLWSGRLRVPKLVIRGAFFYFAFAVPASYGLTWINGQLVAGGIGLVAISALYILDFFLWLIAIIFFLDGLKFQSSEVDAVKHIGSKFEIQELLR